MSDTASNTPETGGEKKFLFIFKKKPKKDKKSMTLKERIIDNINVFLSAYAIAFVIRLFLIEAYQIPSQSMVPNLLVRDILMVEKFTFGTYIPITGWKLPSFVKPHRNDIIVFISPAWKSPGFGKELISLLTLSLINLDNTFDTPKNLVKRLVALPGDTLYMSNRIIYINGQPVKADFLGTRNQTILDRGVAYRNDDFDIYKESLDGRDRVVQRYTGYTGFSPLISNFPSIRVPQKGETLALTNLNNYYRELLALLIERESGKPVERDSGRLMQDGKLLVSWKVKDNYYFAMGDNRDLSEDCRYFGFIPEKNIFGRPLFRYFPFNRFGFNMNESDKTVMKLKLN